MDDAGVRGHHAEVVERLLAPLEELVPLAVALELQVAVDREGVRATEGVGLHRVVDDELDGLEGVDPLGVAAEGGHRVAHRGEVDDAGDAGEVLEDDAGDGEGDLLAGLRLGVPVRERLDVGLEHAPAALGAKQVLQEDAQGVRQPRDVGPLLLEGVQPEDLVLLPAALERRPRAKTIHVLRFRIPVRISPV